MAQDEAQVRMTGDDSSAAAMWKRQFEWVQKVEREMGKMGGTANALGSAGQRISGLAQQWLSVDSAIQLASSSLQRYIADDLQRRTDFGAAQVTFGGAMAKAAEASGETDPKRLQALEDWVIRLAKSTGVKPEQIASSLTTSSSAKGNLSQEVAQQTVGSTAVLRPGIGQEDMDSVVGAALEYQKRWQDATSEQAVAAVLQGFVAARTSNVGQFAKNLAPKIASAKGFGDGTDTQQFLQSVFIGVGQSAGDAEGAQTGTNVLNFFKQLETITKPHLGDTSVEKQFKFLQSDDKEAKALRAGLLGVLNKEVGAREGKPELKSEAATFIALRELLDPMSKTMELVRTVAQQAKGLTDEAVADVALNRASIGKMKSQQAVQAELKLGGITTTQPLSGPDLAVSGIAAKESDRALYHAGVDYIDRAYARLEHQIALWTGGEQAQLEAIANEAQRTAVRFEDSTSGRGSPEDLEQAKSLREFAKETLAAKERLATLHGGADAQTPRAFQRKLEFQREQKRGATPNERRLFELSLEELRAEAQQDRPLLRTSREDVQKRSDLTAELKRRRLVAGPAGPAVQAPQPQNPVPVVGPVQKVLSQAAPIPKPALAAAAAVLASNDAPSKSEPIDEPRQKPTRTAPSNEAPQPPTRPNIPPARTSEAPDDEGKVSGTTRQVDRSVSNSKPLIDGLEGLLAALPTAVASAVATAVGAEFAMALSRPTQITFRDRGRTTPATKKVEGLT